MYARRPKTTASPSRERVLGAVRLLLDEGVFHSSSVEQIAARAGVSRATLYQHFGSRLGLVDAMCEVMDANPALIALRDTDDVHVFLERVTEFWAAEEKLLGQFYGIVAVDPAARDFIDRQVRDRYGELRRLLGRYERGDEATFAAFAVLTSFETYIELRRRSGRSKRDVVATLQRLADVLLGDPSI
jgi:AcrR family transcriptional regulator